MSGARLRLDALVRLLRGIPGLDPGGLWAVPEDISFQLAKRPPEILLLDLPLEAAIRIATRVARDLPAVRMVALCDQDQERHAMSLARSGVTGFLPADASLAEVRATVDSVLRGEVRIPPRIAAHLIRPTSGDEDEAVSARDMATLTGREREVLRLVDRGLTNREIADMLHIGVATVKNHVHNILEKLHVSRRGAATAALRRAGWRPDAPDADSPAGRSGA